jgi:hypothetical protein
MPRPQVEFVHAAQLPWESAGLAEFGWPKLDCKTLSRDDINGGLTAVLRLPAGYADRHFGLASYFELFVLDGACEVNGVSFGLDDYAFVPAGYPFDSLHSQRGVVLLAFFDRAPRRSGWQSVTAALSAELIARIDTHNTPWTRADIDPAVQFLNLAHKVLRHVPETGEKTILLSSGAQTHPHNWREAQLKHACVEEMYLLGGDIIGERGTMYESAYFWRPPGVWHGPFGSRRGSLSLIRFVDGKHRNEWGVEPLPFSLEPSHRPQLPASMPEAGRSAWAPPRY